MTLVVIGPVTHDIVVIGEESQHKTGGATYFQSFVFEKYYDDYLAVVNCSGEDFISDFPSKDKVRVILKPDTHFFKNTYPDCDNLDIRYQSTNFADIPILPDDLKDILPDKIDAFVLNPLNRNDFPLETIDFLKSFNVPVFLSLQGFLRIPDMQVNENYTIKLSDFDELSDILSGVDAIFLDESEKSILGSNFDVGEMVITNGSRGSRIISDGEIRIDAVECEEAVDTTGCGDTYMAAYISYKLQNKSIRQCGEFASLIASIKLKNNGPLEI